MKKLLLLFIYSFSLISYTFSQEVEWENTIGGDKWDELYALQATPDGGCIVGGRSFSDSAFDKTENALGTLGYDDYWVLKLDANGNIQWQNTIGGFSNDELHAIALSNDGGYFLGGWAYSDSSGDKTENNTGTHDYWVVKIDSLGNIQWDKTIGGGGMNWFTCMGATSDGGCIAGGFSNGTAMGEKTENSFGGTFDYWVIKLDATGTVQWDNTIGGNMAEKLYSVIQTTDGGYICGGYSSSTLSGDKTEGCIGYDDYWVVKLDSAGTVQWDNTIGGSDFDYLYSIAPTTDGGSICGGYSQSNISGDKTENTMNGDFWIVKIDSGGTVLWDRTIGGSEEDYLNSIALCSDGGFICGGRSQSNNSGDKTENSLGDYDYWVVKTDSNGTLQSENTVGGIHYDEMYAIAQSSDGGYLAGGRSFSDRSGDKSEDSEGFYYHYWVVKLSEKYNSITGKLFIDANSNFFQDAGEPSISSKAITESNTGKINFSNQSGHYKVSVLDTGNFSVYPAPVNYYSSVPSTQAAYFSGVQQIDSLNDFAFQPAGVFNDFCITITPMGNFRANMNANYMINYENVGTTTLNGTVIFFPDNDVTFVSSNVTPTSVTTDSVVWNVGTLTPFQTGSIVVTVHVNAGTPIGTLINSSVVIEPVAGDANTACNYNSWEVFVTGAVDPNAILVDRDTVLTTELSNPPYLNYIIYFQNTGNDTAFNARVLNNIPQMLDVNSFEFVASSHPMNITYGAHARLMTFTFDNILLPDSNVNEPASHGFIRYRIKPLSTLVAGDSIKNNAAIYFDFNYPVMTDTAVTEIVLLTGVSSQWSVGSGQLAVYPNPAQQSITIFSSLMTNDQCQMTIYDLFGREVYKSTVYNLQSAIKINVSGFSQGIYLIQLTSGEKTARAKFVKQ